MFHNSRFPRALRALHALPTLPLLVTLLLAPLGLTSPLAAQDGPPPEERAAIDDVLGMLESQGDAPLLAFAEARMTEAYREALAEVGLLEHLRGIREAAQGTLGGIGVEMDREGLLLQLEAERTVTLRLVLDDAFQVTRLEVFAATGGEDPANAAADRHIRAIEGLATEGLDGFAAEHIAPELRGRLSADELQTMLSLIRRSAASSGEMTVQLEDDGYVIGFRSGTLDADVHFEIGMEAPYLITRLSVDTDVAPRERAPVEAVGWADLDGRFTAAAENGFAGTVLAIRDGATVLSKSYGLANRATGRPNTSESIYEIGSIPIDFTRAAVLLVTQRGQLDLDAPISRYFPDVPADKQSLTARHLLSGGSGLPNFHHRESDVDRDLGIIDRMTAERRILTSPLLFPPGEGTAHSHSAFTLLAALIERVSGVEYLDFLQTNFFDPAGMTATGPTGETLGFALERFSVGYGSSDVGDPNIPPNWPRTSWLSMGAGVMVSNPADMSRWFDALRSGSVLTGEALETYLKRRTAIGDSDRGFQFLHGWGGGDNIIYVAQNAGARTPEWEALTRALVALITSGGGD